MKLGFVYVLPMSGQSIAATFVHALGRAALLVLFCDGLQRLTINIIDIGNIRQVTGGCKCGGGGMQWGSISVVNGLEKHIFSGFRFHGWVYKTS